MFQLIAHFYALAGKKEEQKMYPKPKPENSKSRQLLLSSLI